MCLITVCMSYFCCFPEVPPSMWNPSTRSEPTCTYHQLLVSKGASEGQSLTMSLCLSGPVLSLAMTSSGEQCFSGGIDSTIQWWNIPSSNVDPYDTYGAEIT